MEQLNHNIADHLNNIV